MYKETWRKLETSEAVDGVEKAEPRARPEKDYHPKPIYHLRKLTPRTRAVLKARRITTCGRLLRAAGAAADRERLAREDGLDPDHLLTFVQRADMARVNGLGAIFGMMLEHLEVRDMAALAAEDPAALHAHLRDYNREERFTRRAPTPKEVESWVAQARSLPVSVTY